MHKVEETHTLTKDIIFRTIFGQEKHKDILIDFIASVLNQDPKEFSSLEILDPTAFPTTIHGKISIFDIRVKLNNGEQISVEMQLAKERGFTSRMLYYNAKMYCNQLKNGDDYTKLAKVVTIVVVDFSIFDTYGGYHSKFEMYSHEAKIAWSDKMQLHILELPKVRKDDSKIGQWMRFLAAKNGDKRKMVAKENVAIQEALGVYEGLTNIERAILEIREDKIRNLLIQQEEDKAEMLAKGLAEGLAEGRVQAQLDLIHKMSKGGLSIHEIAKYMDMQSKEVTIFLQK